MNLFGRFPDDLLKKSPLGQAICYIQSVNCRIGMPRLSLTRKRTLTGNRTILSKRIDCVCLSPHCSSYRPYFILQNDNAPSLISSIFSFFNRTIFQSFNLSIVESFHFPIFSIFHFSISPFFNSFTRSPLKEYLCPCKLKHERYKLHRP